MSAALLVMDFQAGVVDRFSGSEVVSRARVAVDGAPAPGETTVVKRRVSAFTGSALGVVLRSADVDHRVLTEKVFPRQADVLSVDEWVDGLG